MNNIISQILKTKSWEELDEIIAKRIAEEKKNYKSSDNYFSLPNDTQDVSVHSTDSFLHPNYSQIYISTSYPVYSYYFDDEKEIYEIFAQELSKLENPNDLNQVLTAVSESVFSYIGGVKNTGNDFTRLAKLKKSTELGGDQIKFPYSKILMMLGVQKELVLPINYFSFWDLIQN